MNDTRWVLCDECGEGAVEYELGVLAEDLEGKHGVCEHCGTIGKIVAIETDDWRVRLEFRAPTGREESEDAA